MDQHFDTLLNKAQRTSSFLPEELAYLVTAFIPSRPSVLRSKAFLVLSAFCRGVRTSSPSKKVQGSEDEPGAGTLALAQVFQPLITHRLSEAAEDDMLSGVTFLCALFQVDWQSASYIFQQDGFVDLATTLEISPSPSMRLELTRLYAQASGHKACRPLISVDSIKWIRANSCDKTNNAMRAVAVVALIKLSRISDSNATTDAAASNSEDVEHSALLKDMITNNEETRTFLADAVEGLAYLSVNPPVKRMLANADFLKKVFGFFPKNASSTEALGESTLLYGVLVMISNLCAYKSRLSKEQQQIAKLQRMAANGARAGQRIVEESNSEDTDAQVQARCRVLIDSNMFGVLTIATKMESHGMRTIIGQIYLSLVEDKANRGKVLQGGGAKNLARIIKATSTSSSEVLNLPAIQALAKLAITASPIQVFGPNEGNILDAIRPLSEMLLHSSSSTLQQFEAMMALTNLASHNSTCAARIASTPRLLDTAELLQLEDHILIRRAATELICNLIGGSHDVFARYGGDEGEDQSLRSKSKLEVLLAMSDVEDLPTRLAASGALAMLTSSPGACQALYELQTHRHRAFSIIARLIDPSVHLDGRDGEMERGSVNGDRGLVYRGVTCFGNIFLHQNSLPLLALIEEGRTTELDKVLTKLLEGRLGELRELRELGVTAVAESIQQVLSTHVSQVK